MLDKSHLSVAYSIFEFVISYSKFIMTDPNIVVSDTFIIYYLFIMRFYDGFMLYVVIAVSPNTRY